MHLRRLLFPLSSSEKGISFQGSYCLTPVRRAQRSDLPKAGGRFTLSPGERFGVREQSAVHLTNQAPRTLPQTSVTMLLQQHLEFDLPSRGWYSGASRFA